MVRVITVLIILVLSYFFSELDAQSNNISPCSLTTYKQFNSWKGSWNAYDFENKLIRQNNIKEMPDTCIIREN
ncbi:hypothetical protein BTO06_02610 [Tenacibaculum sp. SZ-18]|nr:hypothetical protein BTO06_02610 [Tenacibaculum sp. SZ-18]